MMGKMFWSSDILTGNQTEVHAVVHVGRFWSSDILTGNQTASLLSFGTLGFWSSDILTGNQTPVGVSYVVPRFWSSDILTGNQTHGLVLGLVVDGLGLAALPLLALLAVLAVFGLCHNRLPSALSGHGRKRPLSGAAKRKGPPFPGGPT